MREPEHEKAFEDFLSRRGGIGPRVTEPDGLEPPAELDRVVLANAREAIRIRSSPPLFRVARWAVPFGVAATGVLSLAVMLHLGLLSPKAAREVEKVAADSAAPLPASAPAPAANTAAAQAAAPAEPESLTRRAKQEDPQAWLKRIESLRAQGKVPEADRELEAFHKAWPNYPMNAERDR